MDWKWQRGPSIGCLNVMMQDQTSSSEQRDHLANVRTLLAWVRTAVTIMAFGFVVAKFGILLDQLPGHHRQTAYHFSAIVGTTLVILGAAFLVLATFEFFAVRDSIKTHSVRFRPGIYLLLAALLVIVAVVLAVYLAVTG